MTVNFKKTQLSIWNLMNPANYLACKQLQPLPLPQKKKSYIATSYFQPILTVFRESWPVFEKFHLNPPDCDNHNKPRPHSNAMGQEMHCQNSQRTCIMDHDAILTLLLHHILYCHYVISNFKLPKKATNYLGAGLEVHQLQASKIFMASSALLSKFTTDYISKGQNH